MTCQNLRNVAIIAHVDHGKTSLVDQLLRQSGQFRPGELSGELIMDSNPLEKERGITIFSKNCAIDYQAPDGQAYHINLVDTPGHADFGGEVERVLKLADGVLLLVDAFEGPMPQTRFVLGKALAARLKPIVVLNKMDRADARPDQVHDELLDLFIALGADDDLLEFPMVYASAKDGWARWQPDGPGEDISPVFEAIVRHVPAPTDDPTGPLAMLITTLDYSEYVGRIGIGRVFSGAVEAGAPVARIDRHGKMQRTKVGQVLRFDGLARTSVQRVAAGDICGLVGLDAVDIGDTIASPENPEALPPVAIDEPTLHMTFRINDSPFGGKEGKFVTARQLRQRLERELETNVALRVAPGEEGDDFNVSGRGLLHLGILLENMRREGYELSVGKPRVIYHTDDQGRPTEPIEQLSIDLPDQAVGNVMSLVGDRRAELAKMEQRGAMTHLSFTIPARGLIGLRSRVLTASGGEAIMHHTFDHYGPVRGPIGGRTNGVMIATETGPVTAYAVDQLSDRGVMFVSPGETVYEGQIVGEHNKDNDIPVNATRKKQLTNIRSSTKEATVTLKAPRKLTLEAALEYIEDDELVELTPQSIRLRKRLLAEADRRREGRRAKAAASNP
jgi:GTP-binding protein